MQKIMFKQCGQCFNKKKPEDFVMATGKQTTVKNFVNLVAKQLEIKISWKGKGINEKAVNENGKTIVACDKAYYRPVEVNNLLGDSKKARKKLKWNPKINLNELISEMIEYEMNNISY